MNPEMGTDCKQATSRAAVETKQENILWDDAIVRSHANVKCESHTEMMWPPELISGSNTTGLTRSDLGVSNGKFVLF